VTEPRKYGRDLIEDVEATDGHAPVLWWLGQSGFIIKFHRITFYVDPCLSHVEGRTRLVEAPLSAEQVINGDLILCSHKHDAHMDPVALPAILKASPRARVVLPKSAADHANALGVPYERMTTTDSDLRVEYFKGGLYARVYAVPSAHPELDWTPRGGYPYLGYLIRFGEFTIYHAGDCRPYEGIADRLRPYNVTAALLPISGNSNFEITEAAQLAEDIGARWLVPMHYGTFVEQKTDVNKFVDHMLGFRPSVGFKVFQVGERWMIPQRAE
jgi:L-ascorbate metabolism protein UlaG (beta-lactamase superfamily)